MNRLSWNLDTLEGEIVTATGDCGMAKDKTVKGVLLRIGTDYFVETESGRPSIASVSRASINPILEYHRQPTKGEIKFGEGATHYKSFEASEYLKTSGDVKAWLVCPIDGLRYYKS